MALNNEATDRPHTDRLRLYANIHGSYNTVNSSNRAARTSGLFPERRWPGPDLGGSPGASLQERGTVMNL